MREIDEIILHCTATREGHNYTLADVTRWHQAKGYRTIGYHYLIDLEGKVLKGRPIEKVGSHALGHNAHSIGICYVGGLDKMGVSKDTRTDRQKFALSTLLMQLHARFPKARIIGHNEVSKKRCPCFNAEEYRRYFDQV